MCTIVIARQPGANWPVVLGANRDENLTRPWLPPGRYWPENPGILAGLDVKDGGSWLGVNDANMLAVILNREEEPNKDDSELRSRGELVIEALRHNSPSRSVRAVMELDLQRYRPFNLLIINSDEALWIGHKKRESPITVQEVPTGISMITLDDLNSQVSSRIRRHHSRFIESKLPKPDQQDWGHWEELLRLTPTSEMNPYEALCYRTVNGFGTVNSSLLALPSAHMCRQPPVWRFAAGPPDSTTWEDVGEGFKPGTHAAGEPDWARVIRKALSANRFEQTRSNARTAVVLLLIVERANGLFLVLTERTDDLLRNPGEVCLPGGIIENMDASAVDALIRETTEEIGLSLRASDILGELTPYFTAEHICIIPFVAWTRTPSEKFLINPTEVANLFEVPLGNILQEHLYKCIHESSEWGLRRYCEISLSGRRVWGVTGTILANFASSLCTLHGLIDGLAMAQRLDCS